MLHKSARGFFRFRLLVFRRNRHKSLRKRALGEHPPQQIGQLEGHKKASVAMPAPNARAIIVSRTKPSMRDTDGYPADFGQRTE